MANVSLRDLLEAGVHFGHQTRLWNPKMKPYIYGDKNGIHIIDLQKTARALVDASRFISSSVARGGSVLFVGTKRAARELVAERAAAFEVAEHLGAGGDTILADVEPAWRPGDTAFDAAIDATFRHLTAETPDAQTHDEYVALWEQVDATDGGEAAWTAVLTAMLRHPAFVSY